MNEEVKPPKRKKYLSRWNGGTARYAERPVEDEQHGDTVTETAWVERRKEQRGWRKGARLK